MNRIVISRFLLFLFFGAPLVLSWHIPGIASGAEYPRVDGPCDLVFPRDHGAHPDHRLEWWYYTGNLTAARGAHYGFQITFFRSRISPPGAEKAWPPGRSAWRTTQLYFAHAACSNVEEARFYQEERMARGAAGLAGAEQTGAGVRVFLGPWSVLMEPGRHRLQAATDRFGLDLLCVPEKPPVLHGIRGYSLKGERPESASCYYSFTRLETAGTLRIHGKSVPVQGTAWMDHEFSSAPLERDLTGWDWFSIQLEDKTELMIYLLRREGDNYSGASSGTFLEASGKSHHLDKKDFQVDVLDRWKSGRSGARYPSRWQIRVFPMGLDLTVIPNVADQELITEKTTRVSYWEGSVAIAGRRQQKSVDGVGFVELTGYAKPFQLLE